MIDEPRTNGGVEFTSELYVALMDEIKIRLNEIDRLLKSVGEGESREPRAILDLESCYLQVRLICESIALGALLAHHSDVVTAKLEGHWNADRIFGELVRINVSCFPKAMAGNRIAEKRLHFAELEPPAIDRKALTRIYHKCDDALHRGSIRPLMLKVRKNYEVSELRKWLDELVRLLACHVIIVPYLRKALVVQLWGNANGETTLAEARADGEFAAH